MTTAEELAHADVMKDEHVTETDPLNGKPSAEATGNRSKVTFPRQLLHERHIGPFERSFTFPGEVDTDKMQARLKNGLLRVIVPKKFQPVTSDKRVPVQ